MKSIRILALFCTCLIIILACNNTPNGTNLEEELNLNLIAESVADEIAFINVNVVPMDRNEVLSGYTVIVQNGIITEMGLAKETTPDPDADIIDGEGKLYLMPGLSDMHVHLGTFNDLFLFIANGVTTVREMWGWQGLLNFRNQDGFDSLRVPSIYIAAPGLNGPGSPWPTPTVATAEVARQTVREHSAAGYDFIKVYNLLSLEVYNAIMDEADKEGIRVIGHVPRAVGPKRVIQASQVSVEHLIGYGVYASTTSSLANGTLDMQKVNEIATLAINDNLWHTPTIAVDSQTKSKVDQIKNSTPYSYITPSLQNRFRDGFFQGFSSVSVTESRHKQITKLISDQNGHVLLGTDAGFGYMLPGFSIHDELNDFVEAGLTPYQAIAAGTSNAAIFFEGDNPSFGTIAVGKRADLVLLTKNPLDRVENFDSRAGVMLRGHWYSQVRIQEILDEIMESNNTPNKKRDIGETQSHSH